MDHKLDGGDALVFKLIEAVRFKIYIIRAFLGSVGGYFGGRRNNESNNEQHLLKNIFLQEMLT